MSSFAISRNSGVSRNRTFYALALVCGLAIFGAGLGSLPPSAGGNGFVPESASSKKKVKKVFRYAPNVVVITFQGGAEASFRQALERNVDLLPDRKVRSKFFVRYFIGPKAQASGHTVESMCKLLKTYPGVRYAEPDYALEKEQYPNDPHFPSQWGLHNTGQAGGLADADIDAPEGWALLPSGSDVLVAVLDDGVQTDHPDLAANIAVNSGEIAGNGIDDDANGYIDDVTGWDTADNDNNPYPGTASDSHGTHVSGIIAAVTDNVTGVAGTAKRVKILPVRMYKGQDSWLTSLANGVDFARLRGASSINVSYNLDGYTMFVIEAIQRARDAGIPYINSAGNNGENIDGLRGTMKQHADNIMFVAALHRSDGLTTFSNYGKTVEIGAPGQAIMSTVTNGGYQSWDGTSMATPFVAACAAMVRATYPSLTPEQVIARLKSSADHRSQFLPYFPGGRLNLANALDPDAVAPNTPKLFKTLGRTSSTIKATFQAAGDDGVIGGASRYELRASANPINTGNFELAEWRSLMIGGATSGTPMTVRYDGLAPGQAYYVAVRAFDNAGNASGIATLGPIHTISPIWFDKFEVASWTGQSGKTWTRLAGAGRSGGYAWDDSPDSPYGQSEDSALTQDGTVNVTGTANVTFGIDYQVETGWDYVFLEASLDNGSTWSIMRVLTGSSDGWQDISSPVPGSGTRNIKFRVRLTSDDLYEWRGVFIDSVSVVQKVELMYDNMEDNAGNWTNQSPWQLSTERAFSPTQAWSDSVGADYVDYANLLLSRDALINTQGLEDLEVTLRAYLDLEGGYDFLHVLATPDGGPTVRVGLLSGNVEDWVLASFKLPVVPSLRLAFRMTADESYTFDGVNLDDVSVIGEPLIGGTQSYWLKSLSVQTPIASGGTGTGTITINKAAGPGGLTVDLKASNAYVTLPDEIVIAEGQTAATFSVQAVVLAAPKKVTISALFDGVTLKQVVDLRAPELVSASLSPTSLVGGTANRTTLTVTIDQPAPAGGIPIALQCDRTDLATVPTSVRVAEGQTSRSISFAANAVSADTPVKVTAIWQGVRKPATLSVLSHKPVSLTVTPTTFYGGSGTPINGVIKLNAGAPVGGLAVALTVNNDAISVPATVTVPQGSLTASFAITSNVVTFNRTSVITAAAGGASVKSASLTVQVHGIATVTLNPTTVVGGSGTAVTGTVTLNAPAGAGGFEVQLSSTIPAVASPTAATLVIPAGQSSGTFTIQHTAVTATKEVGIRGTARGKTISAKLTVTP